MLSKMYKRGNQSIKWNSSNIFTYILLPDLTPRKLISFIETLYLLYRREKLKEN